jgi:hypothetical protein
LETYVTGYSQYDAKRNISSLLRTRTPLRLAPPVPIYGSIGTLYDLYVEETYNWLIKEWEADIEANPEYYDKVQKYFDNPLLFCYYLNNENITPDIAEKGDRNIVIDRGAQFVKADKAWRLPYNPEQKNFSKEASAFEGFHFETSEYGRVATSDAAYFKNLIDDILAERLTITYTSTETEFNGFLNEPVFRPIMRFYPDYLYLNSTARSANDLYITGPYVYVRTNTKNPYVYQYSGFISKK